MRLNVLNELRQQVGSIAVFELAEPGIRLDDIEINRLSGTLTLARTNRGLLGNLTATAIAPEHCARCLTPVDCRLAIEFEEEFIPVVDAITARRVRISAAEEGFRIGPDFILDLGEPLRQYMLMLEPPKPLCRPECAGICPTCGADLNTDSCGCAGTVDARWAVLAGFHADKTKGA